MTCTACGEKPKDTAKGFTKAVIEINNPGKLTLFRKVLIPSSLGDETAVPPTIGKYHNVLLEYEINQHLYLYSSDGIPTQLSANIEELEEELEELGIALEDEASTRAADDDLLDTKIEDETESRQLADSNLQSQIDSIAASSDVKDIVGTYAELQQYDTSTLGNNDIIKVLQDETQSDATTYYRWSTSTQTFTLIGEEGPYYTKSATDTLLANKQNTLTAGNNINISGDIISATDTKYSPFVGTDGIDQGVEGLVPAPMTSDVDKFLKSDGTWSTVENEMVVVQSLGTSTADVMSQSAVTGALYNDISTRYRVQIGTGASSTGDNSIAIGRNAFASGNNSIALGRGANATVQGQMDIGTGSGDTGGYASSSYRLLTGLYDPQGAHDAATKSYVDIVAASVPTTFTNEEWNSLWA